MNTHDILVRLERHGGSVTPELENLIASPQTRRELYALFYKERPALSRNFLLALFRAEMDFRRALWQSEIEDDEDYFEGIYQCAFLIYCVGDPGDTYLLWEAKHINMDVGIGLGAEYFFGAGIDRTLTFLKQEGTDVAKAIIEYLKDYPTGPEGQAQQKEWEEFCVGYFT